MQRKRTKILVFLSCRSYLINIRTSRLPMIINDEFPLIIEQIGMHAIADQSLNTSPPFRLTTDYDRLEKMLLKYEPEIR